MSSRDVQMSDAPKLKRSRNGCNECRRLHRRCDEGKPACLNCREASKVCSYEKPLSWGGRPFRKSTFGHALDSGVVEIPNVGSNEATRQNKSFVYGQAESSSGTTESSSDSKLVRVRSRSMPSVNTGEQGSSGSPSKRFVVPSVSVPWLSRHHQMLVHHFVESTVTLFTRSSVIQQQIRATIIPMAVESNHGFSLIAAILSLASTHRMNLGLHQDVTEIEYWRDMSVGHLRRPAVQEYEATQNVLAATALILCIREVISDAEKPCAWRLHLQGSFTTLTCSCDRVSSDVSETERVLKMIARSLEVHTLLPTDPSLSCTGCMDIEDATACHETLGFPDELALIFKQIRSLRLERNALQSIEFNSDSSNMHQMWGAVRGRCLELIVQLRDFSDPLALDDSNNSDLLQLYGYVALLQIYFGVLDLSSTDSGLRSTLNTAIQWLRGLRIGQSEHIDPHLVFPLFIIGCLVHQPEDRILVMKSLERIAKVLGKGNAVLANVALEELWRQVDVLDRPMKQADVEEFLEKGWDLSLW